MPIEMPPKGSISSFKGDLKERCDRFHKLKYKYRKREFYYIDTTAKNADNI